MGGECLDRQLRLPEAPVELEGEQQVGQLGLRVRLPGGVATALDGGVAERCAPGQAVRYGGLATKETPARLLAERGVTGCLEILAQFVWESRLGILLFAAAFVRYVVIAGMPAIARETHRTAALLVAASLAIVVTLFVSPTTTDRVMFASGVLLVAALSVYAEVLFAERAVPALVAWGRE